MPELPELESYVEALRLRVAGRPLLELRVLHPFLLRTAEPPPAALAGCTVLEVRRVGKRIVFACQGGPFMALHLMIAGRLHWKARPAGPSPPAATSPGLTAAALAAARRRGLLAAWSFSNGVLELTEAGTKRRASLHLGQGPEALAALDPGGLEVLDSSPEEFARRLALENHTAKRALTDPRLFAGIGNAYSDEILHAARLSPFLLSGRMSVPEMDRLHAASRKVLTAWIERRRADRGEGFPEGISAFHPAMAVHGRYGKPCPVCATPVQRIRYAENECNYCPTCQTGGAVLADRALSRLLKSDWPRTVEELERLRRPREG